MAKQLPAGKSKLKAAAKRKVASKKTSSKATTKKAAVKPKASAPSSPIVAPDVQAPVSSPTGSLVSPETWRSDQARLQSKYDDAQTVEELNQAEADADENYTKANTEATRASTQRKLELDKQQGEFEKSKAGNYNDVNSTMAYRGASRSSAAARATRQVDTFHNNLDSQYRNERTDADNLVSDTATNSYTEREKVKGRIAAKRGWLATKAASEGVLSEGSSSNPALPPQVTAPTVEDTPAPEPATASEPEPAKVTPLPALRVNTAKTKTKSGNAASNTAAAKRRIAAKKKKKVKK